MDKNTCCQICMREFFKVSNLRRHIKNFHPEQFEPSPKKQFSFTCEVCGKNFSYIRNYRSHLRTHDPNPPNIKIMKKCPLCPFVSEKTELHEHFEKNHDINLVTEKLSFPDSEAFMKWKMSMENDRSHFVRSYAQQTKYYDEVILFVCHRSGHYFKKVKKMDKAKNDVITKKIGGFCPANIKMMKKNDGTVLVSFLQTHVGHSDEVENQPKESGKKLKSILLRHKNSCNLQKSSLVKSENVWQFHSQNKDEIYVLSANENKCESECPLTCGDCKACIHKYSCSCKDWTIKWNMCVHIHLLCRILNEEKAEKEGHLLSSQSNSNNESFAVLHQRFSTFIKKDYKRCYELLQIDEGSDQEQIRTAYLNLAKKYHPDSGTEHASAEKFYEIDQAFRALNAKISRERWDREEENTEEQDIKHTAPQHRQYLNYDGYGIGNPFQREKQYVKQKAIRASQNLFKHRVEKAAAEEHALMKKKSLRHDIKTKYGIDRLVEDLIQESMSKGEFSKLSGVGKPLKERHNRNPFVDFVTHKLNEVLIDNGFTPEWITLNKEIREDVEKLRRNLSEERKRFKKCPLSESDALLWQECYAKYKNEVKDLNTKIDKFNLLVPILNKQFFHVNLDREAEKILLNGEYCDDSFVRKQCDKTKESFDDDHSILGYLDKIFK